MKLLITGLWLIAVSVILLALGWTREVIIFDIAIMLFLLLEILVPFFIGKKAKLLLRLVPEAARESCCQGEIVGGQFIGLIPHAFDHLDDLSTVRITNKKYRCYDFVFIERGFYDEPLLFLSWGDILGFFSWKRAIKLEQPCWIYPKDVYINGLRHGLEIEGEQERLIEIGDYGDVRRVHWQATMRTGILTARQSSRSRNYCCLMIMLDGHNDNEVTDYAYSWFKHLGGTGMVLTVAIVGKETRLLPNISLNPDTEKSVLRTLAITKGPHSTTSINLALNKIGENSKVLFLGTVPAEFREYFEDYEILYRPEL